MVKTNPKKMLQADQVKKGVMYSYSIEGDERMGVLQDISKPHRGNRIIQMDNGDQIQMEAFVQVAEVVADGAEGGGDEPVLPSVDSEDQAAVEANNLMTGRANTDADGNPVLGTEGGENLDNIVSSQEEFKQEQKKNDPVLALLKKANTKEVELSIKLPFHLVDKSLFNVIKDSFDEESQETIYQFVLDSVSPEVMKEAIKEEVQKHYNDEEN